MLVTPHARFARLFLGMTPAAASALDMVADSRGPQLAQPVLNVMSTPANVQPSPQYGQAPAPIANQPPAPSGPIAPPQPAPAPGAQASGGGMSTTTMIAIGAVGFGAVYLLLRRRS